MAKDFNNFGHKNAELLRHYIVREMKKINKKLSSDSNQILGCFVASIVDILIVMMYEDILKQLSIFCRFKCIIVLLIFFVIFSKFVAFLLGVRRINDILLGRNKNVEKIKDDIDEFDNIACDGLLICQNYIRKYKTNENEEMQEFYLYEIVHHLKKSVKIFEMIYSAKDLYIRILAEDKDYKIDNYRIENFRKITNEIYTFLKKEMNKNKKLKKDLLIADIKNIDIALNKIY